MLQTSGIEFGKKLRRRKVEEGRGGDPGQSLVACRYMMDLLKLSHEGEKETVGRAGRGGVQLCYVMVGDSMESFVRVGRRRIEVGWRREVGFATLSKGKVAL